MLKKKLSCCRDTALFGQISDSGRSVNTNESVNMTYVNFINMSFNISNSVPSYVVSADMLRIDKHIHSLNHYAPITCHFRAEIQEAGS